MREYDEHDPDQLEGPSGHELVFGGDPLPQDARRLGLTPYTEEGALVAMAGALDSRRRFHRLVAWILIVALVGPVLLGFARQVL